MVGAMLLTKLAWRLAKAVEEFDFVETNPEFFHCILHNDGDFEDSVDQLANVLRSWYPQQTKKISGAFHRQHFSFFSLKNGCILAFAFLILFEIYQVIV